MAPRIEALQKDYQAALAALARRARSTGCAREQPQPGGSASRGHRGIARRSQRGQDRQRTLIEIRIG
jgi:hypothetical protein